MENLTRTQIVLLVLLVSFVTSLATGIVTVTLVNQAPPPVTNTINRVVEKITPGENLVTERIVTSEEKSVKVIKEVSPAVVSVIATKDIPVVERQFINPFGDDDFFKRFFPDINIPQYEQKGVEKKQVSSGSGFFVSKDGLIVTNRHVVEDAQAEYSIIMNDGKKLSAKVLDRNPAQDIAVLKVDGLNFPFIPLGDSDKLNQGQTVIAIGNALGEFQNTVSVGVVSGLNRMITAVGSASGPEDLSGLIQTDAAINPGNSGGPLIDLSGKVIGMNTARAQGENVGFALPVNLVKRDIADIKEFGKIKYPFMGIRYKVEETGLIIQKGENQEPAIQPGSPAEKAGIKEGDLMTEFGGVKLDQKNSLGLLLSKKRVGETVKVKVKRDGKEMIISLILEERPSGV
ncbi:PDZ domain-containing protein [Candidatus Parcubacteria bacterium]|nr:MAG: PDZ domain-containing protein [Candidatus Parcubacteria bacterium]